MNENKNISSKLDGLFDVARKQQPVMNLNEVSDLIKNPSAYQKRKTGALTWFGVFLLVGLGVFGVSFLFNNNSSTDTQSGNSIALTSETQKMTNETQSEQNTIQPNAAVAEKQDEASASAGKSDLKNTASVNSLAGKDEIKNNTASTVISDHAVLTHKKAESNVKTVSKHYEGDATISFLSDNKKIKMTITPANEIEELKVNDQLIAHESYKEFKNIIDEGLKLKNEKVQSGGGDPEEQALSASKRTVMNAMMKELTSDGLISPDKPFNFTLTGQEIFLNDEKQSAETFEKYKGLYEKVTGEKLPAKYNLRIKR